MEVEELGQVVAQEAGVLPNPETKNKIFKCFTNDTSISIAHAVTH
jgi:hypothetical protein